MIRAHSYLITSFLTIVLSLNQATCQVMTLPNGSVIEISPSGKVILNSAEGSISEISLEGDLMHSFLISEELLMAQTRLFSYYINTENLSINERLDIPESLARSSDFYYFKIDTLTIELSFTRKQYGLKYFKQRERPLFQIGSSYEADLPKEKRVKQAIWDIKNKIFYANFSNSTEFYMIDFKKNRKVNTHASRKMAIDKLAGTYWYMDTRTYTVYLLAENKDGKQHKLFHFPNGLPEPKETWVSGGVTISRDDTTWEDHGLLIKEINFIPKTIHDGVWMK